MGQIKSLLTFTYNLPKIIYFNFHQLLGRPIIFTGGGYFRLIPYQLIKKWQQQSNYVMTYFHPRDFDADQPMIKDLSLLRKFKSYVGLKGASKKLSTWLQEDTFIDVTTANSIINWGKVPVVQL